MNVPALRANGRVSGSSGENRKCMILLYQWPHVFESGEGSSPVVLQGQGSGSRSEAFGVFGAARMFFEGGQQVCWMTVS